jgi:hypothetical protein
VTRQFCDRCNTDITGETAACVSLVRDADEQGNGTITDNWDLCTGCVEALDAFIKAQVGGPKKKGRARG